MPAAGILPAICEIIFAPTSYGRRPKIAPPMQREGPMRVKCLVFIAGITAVLNCGGLRPAGTRSSASLAFPLLAIPKWQAEFGARRRDDSLVLVPDRAQGTFEGVLQQDPNCAIAYWGVGDGLPRQHAGHDADAGPKRTLAGRPLEKAPPRSERRPSASATGSRH